MLVHVFVIFSKHIYFLWNIEKLVYVLFYILNIFSFKYQFLKDYFDFIVSYYTDIPKFAKLKLYYYTLRFLYFFTFAKKCYNKQYYTYISE